MTILVTGGAGFIGSNFVLDWLSESRETIINLDALTYAGNLETLRRVSDDSAHVFVHGDICDEELVGSLLDEHRPRAIVHFAAESHVDRSIHGPDAFLKTNIAGTFSLLQAARAYFAELPEAHRSGFRFLHVSTDEVYGSLGPEDSPFSEATPYAPNSPYSASKAASDHLARAWHHTYGLPVLTTNCSNNYGPHQFPEKLIPLVIANALEGQSLPIYGDGRCRSMVTGRMFGTGSTSGIIARQCAWFWRMVAPAKHTTSAAMRSERTSIWFARSAACSTSCDPTRAAATSA
jgi:dTDP-glucose 4,6-dehydratase